MNYTIHIKTPAFMIRAKGKSFRTPTIIKNLEIRELDSVKRQLKKLGVMDYNISDSNSPNTVNDYTEAFVGMKRNKVSQILKNRNKEIDIEDLELSNTMKNILDEDDE